MAVEIGYVSQLLAATLDPQQMKKAEIALRQEEKKPRFSLALLNIVASEPLPYNTRLAAALCFKNFIRTHWVKVNAKARLPDDERNTIKQEVVGLMISSPPSIQAQLGEAISIIADSDFWEDWDTLVQDLVNRLSSTDCKVTNGVLEVAHSIFGRWRPLFRTDELYIEINHVLSVCGEPFIQMLEVVDRQIESNKDNAAALKGWLESMDLLVKILFDLCCQDIAPVVESHLQGITTLLQKYLLYTSPLFDDDEDEASPVENLKSDICDVLRLFASKFEEDFRPYAESFITAVWNLLTTTGPEQKYDLLFSKALQFLTAVANEPRHAQNFNNEDVVGQIVEKVILPNAALRESDIEMFEDEPIEFIRRDLEGSDTDSRRRAATDFLRKLLEHFEVLITKVVYKYIEHYLTQGQSDWKAKDTAVYLFLAIAAKGTVTAAQGVRSVNQYINVVDFFQKHVANDLVAPDGVEPIAKVDAIKFLHNLRSQLSKEQWHGAFQPLMQNLASDNYVVYTYAAIAVERVLYLTNDAGEHTFTRTDIEPFAKDLIGHLFNLVERDPSPPKLQENEFLMQCIMRVLIVIRDGAAPIMDWLLEHLISITNVMKANPSNPRFYYFHFEAIGALIRLAKPSTLDTLESKLWEPFSGILNEDVSEFIPYVFQLFAAMIEADPQRPLPDNFKTLLQPMLMPAVWDTRGNVPACTKFLSALIPKVKDVIVAEDQMTPLFGLFQSLLASKKSEQSAFDILDVVVNSFPASVLQPHFHTLLEVIFIKLQSKPSDSLKTRFARFYHLVSAKGKSSGYGADFFIKEAEALQQGIFTSIYLTIITKATRQFARPVDRKLGVISYTKTLCESEAFLHRYAKGWVITCEHLLDLLQNPPEVTAGFGDEIITEADTDDIGFGVGYTPLNTCRRAVRDDFPDIENVQTWARDNLSKANAAGIIVPRAGDVARYGDAKNPDPAKAQTRMEATCAALAPYIQ